LIQYNLDRGLIREEVHDGSQIRAVSVVNTIDSANISPNSNETSEIRSVDRPSLMDDLREDEKVYSIGAPGKRAHDRTAALVLHDRYSTPFWMPHEMVSYSPIWFLLY
jgi:hypothetical protein